MVNKNFPKVLIIGHSFGTIDGIGVTYSNLFKNWPADSLAVLYYKSNISFKDNHSLCSNYYYLTQKEIIIHPLLRPFFNITSNKNNLDQGVTKENKIKSYLKNLALKLINWTGIYSIRFKFIVSDDLRKWIKDFEPDIIYSALGSLFMIDFVYNIKNEFNYKLAIHIMDDWPNTFYRDKIFKSYWKKKYNKEFNKILKVTDIPLSISGAMTKDYLKRYNRKFIPFHNPIELDQWLKEDEHNNETQERYVLFVGRIGKIDNYRSVLLMAKVIDHLSANNKINFKIFTPDVGLVKNELKSYKNVKVYSAVSHSAIIPIIKQAYILFLPLDFSKESILYTRLSMSTKVSEFMISKVPTIVLAPKNSALYEFATQEKWAVTVDKFDFHNLLKAVFDLLYDKELREKLRNRAYELAYNNFDANKVREHFRNVLSN